MSNNVLSQAEIESLLCAMDGGGEFVNILGGNVCAKLSAMGRVSEIQPPRVHDNRKDGAFDLAGLASGASLSVTPLVHPESGIELCVVDRSPDPTE